MKAIFLFFIFLFSMSYAIADIAGDTKISPDSVDEDSVDEASICDQQFDSFSDCVTTQIYLELPCDIIRQREWDELFLFGHGLGQYCLDVVTEFQDGMCDTEQLLSKLPEFAKLGTEVVLHKCIVDKNYI